VKEALARRRQGDAFSSAVSNNSTPSNAEQGVIDELLDIARCNPSTR